MAMNIVERFWVKGGLNSDLDECSLQQALSTSNANWQLVHGLASLRVHMYVCMCVYQRYTHVYQNCIFYF